jgi:histidinol-phosphate aminotransferase
MKTDPMTKIDNIDTLVRPNIRNLKPYRSARDDFDKGILLDANENSLGAPMRHDRNLHRYPSPTQDELRIKIAKFRHVLMENIFTGVGSDEAIDLLIRIFCEPGKDAILITPPTYGMYKVSAEVNDVKVVESRLTGEFQPDVENILDKADKNTKILFLCSPNNPTANDLKRTDLLMLIELFPGVVVVDEAYIDFSDLESMAAVVPQYPNLVVLQTFSKAFGLAGIRLGVAISSPPVINYMLKIKAPYNVNKLTAEAALEAFSHMNLIHINIDKIREERVFLVEQLNLAPTVEKVYQSNANFILFKIKDAQNIYRQLAEKGIIVRYRGNEPGCQDCLRVTVGMPNENLRFLKTLKEITA